MAKKHYAEETMQLIGIVDHLFRGAKYSIDNAPGQLRRIADAMEAKIKAEGPTAEEELKARYR